MAQFTEEEAQRIFARAAEHQHAANDDAPGFSLEELEEIGKAAGLSPEHIATAVSEIRLRLPAARTPARVMGVQTDVQRSRVIPGELTDEMWEGVVSQLRRTFKTKGITAEVGRTREWTGTNSAGGLSNLLVVASPVEGGTKITLETSRTEEARQTKWLPAVFAIMTLFMPLLGLTTGNLDHPVIWIFSAIMVTLGGVGYFSTYQGFKQWSERRQREFESLLDQFELMARSTPKSAPMSSSTLAPTAAPSGFGLDELAEASQTPSNATRSRTRA